MLIVMYLLQERQGLSLRRRQASRQPQTVCYPPARAPSAGACRTSWPAPLKVQHLLPAGLCLQGRPYHAKSEGPCSWHLLSPALCVPASCCNLPEGEGYFWHSHLWRESVLVLKVGVNGKQALWHQRRGLWILLWLVPPSAPHWHTPLCHLVRQTRRPPLPSPHLPQCLWQRSLPSSPARGAAPRAPRTAHPPRRKRCCWRRRA